MVNVEPSKFSEIIAESMCNGDRNTAILMYILDMIRRGDSKETILDVYYFLSSYPEPK